MALKASGPTEAKTTFSFSSKAKEDSTSLSSSKEQRGENKNPKHVLILNHSFKIFFLFWKNMHNIQFARPPVDV
jgi:hypothetical protein